MTGNKKYAQYFMLINKNEKKNLNKKKLFILQYWPIAILSSVPVLVHYFQVFRPLFSNKKNLLKTIGKKQLRI